MNSDEFKKVQAEYEGTGFHGICDRSSKECSPSTEATKIWSQPVGLAYASAIEPAGEEIYLFCDFHAPENARAIHPVLTPPNTELLPENLEDTVSQLSGPGFAKLRSKLSGQYGIRLQSTGAAASPGPVFRIIMQTLDVSPARPCVVEFDQFILIPFTGPGQFDLVEHDSSAGTIVDDDGDPVGGVTIATKAGFTDGVTTGAASRFSKPITSNKIYSVVFVPGTAGDGIFSIRPRDLTSNE